MYRYLKEFINEHKIKKTMSGNQQMRYAGYEIINRCKHFFIRDGNNELPVSFADLDDAKAYIDGISEGLLEDDEEQEED